MTVITEGRAVPAGSTFSKEAVAERRAIAARGARAAQNGSRGPQGPAGRPGPTGRQGGSQRRSQPSVRLTRRAPSGSGTAYQNVILAEFVVAVLLVAATPFASKNKAGVSPYAASDMLQLMAIVLVYLLLALVSGASNSAARFSAWFGGLILLTVGLGEAARLAGLFGVLGLSAGGAGGGQSAQNGGPVGPPGHAVPPGQGGM